MNKITEDLQNEVQWELENNILPFWMNRMIDNEYGGFHGQITGNGQRVVHAPKGAILNARILWTFSAAYRLLRKPEYLETATRAKRYLIDKFYDQEFEGIYWELDYTGQPVQTKKQIYALGFAIYGLSEYNYIKAKTVTDLAQMIGYGVNSFRMKFKKVFGIPAYEWLMQEKSKRLLVAIANSEDDFKNIIDEFDFSSHSHFYKFCKARFGYSPTELRKKLKSL